MFIQYNHISCSFAICCGEWKSTILLFRGGRKNRAASRGCAGMGAKPSHEGMRVTENSPESILAGGLFQQPIAKQRRLWFRPLLAFRLNDVVSLSDRQRHIDELHQP